MGIRGTIDQRAMLRHLAVAAICAAAVLGAPVRAADGSGTGHATLLRPLSLVNTDDLQFGSLIVGATGGTVTINPSTNARTTTGGVIPVGGGAHRAVFQGAGNGGFIITITGSTTATLARAGGGAPAMTATLTRSIASGATPLFGSLAFLTGTPQTYHVGGTLAVPANQPAGDYSGSFTLTVNYY